MRMDNDNLNALTSSRPLARVCAKMLERERATSMGLRAAGPSGFAGGGILDIAIGVSDPIFGR